MKRDLKEKRDFLSLLDLTHAEASAILKRAGELKSKRKEEQIRTLAGRGVALLFEKSSTRTRVSFECAIHELGGYSVFLNYKDTQLARGERIADTARTLSRYVSAVVMRTFSHSTILEMSRYASVPVINGLSDLHHPCQALADVMTIIEKKGRAEGLRVAYVGDGNNVANSLIEAALVFGFRLVLASPPGFEPDKGIIGRAVKAGADVEVIHDVNLAADSADVLYTDVWVSMGKEDEAKMREDIFKGYQINSRLLKKAKKDVIVMHCLPAYRGKEITTEVMDGPRSVVWDQAENRLHTQKGLLEFLILGRL